ncbi:hypothetical protein [Streptococcus oriscaviae]|uniref:DUF202 domain-containing protein n=1 Tax=Streptococcus oriscaviae TaxID=2781599 RepID=A0ABX7YK13_9STRE|nr:hypothetical protein [Streptococcus oriscaviae]QUE53699.1 hypothetical protein INT76_07630 [Streptococcus oriscaviae]
MENEHMEDYKEFTLYAKDKEQAHRLVEELFSENSQEKIRGGFWTRLFSFLRLVSIFLWRSLFVLLLTPFFLFTWLKTAISIGLGIALIYAIIGSLYYANTGRAQLDMTTLLWTESRVYTIAGIAIFLALLVTWDSYTKRDE